MLNDQFEKLSRNNHNRWINRNISMGVTKNSIRKDISHYNVWELIFESVA